jgi:4,5-dihydroxyphthalate decarboxylase
MANLPITFGCGLYDRMVPLYSGEVTPEGIDLTFTAVDNPRDVFEAMLDGRFQAAEMSTSDLMRRLSAGVCPFVAIPVFPSRVFRHGMIVVNAASGITEPKQLEGRRVGVPHFPMTAAVWIRGLLRGDHGVDVTKITWVQDSPFRPVGDDAKLVEALKKRFSIEDNTSGKSLEALIIAGEIDGFIGADVTEGMRKSPNVRRLFPDFRKAEQEYYRRTRIFPIMHSVVIRRDVYEKNPFVAKSLYEALTRSKDIARAKMRYMGTLRYMLPWMIAEIEELDQLFEGDPFVYGLEPNRANLETLRGYLEDQALLSGPLSVDDVFVDVTS